MKVEFSGSGVATYWSYSLSSHSLDGGGEGENKVTDEIASFKVIAADFH